MIWASCLRPTSTDILTICNAQNEKDITFTTTGESPKTAISFASDNPPEYVQVHSHSHPPPSYSEALNDLPPDYDYAPSAQQKILPGLVRVSRYTSTGKNIRRKSPGLLTDPAHDVSIDWTTPIGIREHKKKKKGGAAARNTSGNDDGENEHAEEGGEDGGGGGDAGNEGGAAGNGNGGDGDGDGDGDGWDEWVTTGNKKKDKKKKKEEEARKAEEERLAKEEEEKADAGGGGNNLSWADEMDGNDDSWAGFATVGKKKKKKGKVRRRAFVDCLR